MRTFDLVRDTDITGISGTGKVAEGVLFTDGWCALHWTGHLRTTTVFQSLEDLLEIHGHHGATRVAFHDAPGLKALPKPHLALGAEGPGAELVAVANGCGVVEEGARLAYDRIREILAPPGWDAYATFWQGGEVCLRIQSPARYLRTTRKPAADGGTWFDVHQEQDSVYLQITREETKLTSNGGSEDSGVDVSVDGVLYRAKRSQFATIRREPA